MLLWNKPVQDGGRKPWTQIGHSQRRSFHHCRVQFCHGKFYWTALLWRDGLGLQLIWPLAFSLKCKFTTQLGPWACTRLNLAFLGELSLVAPVLGRGFHCRCEGSSNGVLIWCIFNSSPTLSHQVLIAVGLTLTKDKCQLDHCHISWDTVSGLCGLQCPWLKKPQPKELE